MNLGCFVKHLKAFLHQKTNKQKNSSVDRENSKLNLFFSANHGLFFIWGIFNCFVAFFSTSYVFSEFNQISSKKTFSQYFHHVKF